MPTRRAVALLLASTALLALSACTSGAAETEKSAAVVGPQADISGEWVLTRTVLTSDDASNPNRAVGATSVRYLSVKRDDCGTALCAGTVLSGIALEGREETELVQTDGGLDYTFTGRLDCMNSTTGGVLAAGAFEFTQTAKLVVGDSSDVDGTATASALTGTISYTDTLTEAGSAAGCVREPQTVTVEYTVAAVRPPTA